VYLTILEEECSTSCGLGKKEKEGIHLTNWKNIAKPEKDGGWGIKNIFIFGQALAEKILWRCLMLPGLWHEVILQKYLKRKTVESWFRQGRKKWNGISNFWRALTSSMNIISDWLVWKPGSGRDIRIGADPMVGTHSFYKLSEDLCILLKEQGITCLAHAGSNTQEGLNPTRWKTVDTLGLEGALKDEWINYTKGLVSVGIELTDEKDSLLWSWDTKEGQVTSKLAYKVQMLEGRGEETKFWYTEIWEWQLPIKVKLFIWLLLEQRILTWDNLIKRGFQGPSLCVLCKDSEETMLHLFGECRFIKNIWHTLTKELKLVNNWQGGQFENSLLNWTKRKENWNELPCFISWEVWKHRNLMIFEDKEKNLFRVCNYILQDLGEQKLTHDTFHIRIDRPPAFDWDGAVGFFDGASQERGTKCGAGAILKCPSLGTYKLKMNCGNGTNTKGEMLALWLILYFSYLKQVPRLLLMGDSKVIIDWYTNDNNLQVISLQPWMIKIRALSRQFQQTKAQHIYINYNQVVDRLSKEALSCEEGGIYCTQEAEGQQEIFERFEINI
jgi:ribonuclease HI